MNEIMPINPITLIVIALLLGLLPFAIVMVTSYAKLVIVFTIIRNALGLQSTPPNMVVNGLAMILSLYIMYPVVNATYEAVRGKDLMELKGEEVGTVFHEASKPIRAFLKDNSQAGDVQFFVTMAHHIWPREQALAVDPDSFIILAPAFLLRELTEAFQIGFLLYLPFVVIDLVVSNILLAMGMMMVSPTTISLPFKLLLFVFVDGWSEMIKGLILTYQ